MAEMNLIKKMLMVQRILVLMCIVVLFASCSSSRSVVTAESAQPRLVFGNGGGFTGVYTSYKLENDGRVYSLLPDSSWVKTNRINKKQCRKLFSQAEVLKNTQPATDYPGNITWFVLYNTGNELVEYKWGDFNVAAPEQIINLYNQLIKTVN